MQASWELTSSPNMSSDFNFGEEFIWKMKLDGSDGDKTEKAPPSGEESGEDDEDFSFACTGGDSSPISPSDVFQNGRIKPSFPLFDQSLLFAGDSVPSEDDLPRRPSVKKVFIQAEDSSPPLPSSSSSSEGTEGKSAGPYCEWSGKAVEASPEICTKCNSTGFSKLWKFRDLVSRSNSDGRDAFVFLNGSTSTSSKRDEKVDTSETPTEKKTLSKPKVSGARVKAKAKKTGTLSAHELHYVRNRASREEDRRRSYLPYRPELFGFFTNVNGGLSRNVHPF